MARESTRSRTGFSRAGRSPLPGSPLHSDGRDSQDYRGPYVLLKLFRWLVTVNVPSARAETLIQYACPLWTGGGGAPGPGVGAGIGLTGMAVDGSSARLAMNSPGWV